MENTISAIFKGRLADIQAGFQALEFDETPDGEQKNTSVPNPLLFIHSDDFI